MYCTNCGNPIREGGSFCTNCGTAAQAPVFSDSAAPDGITLHEPAFSPIELRRAYSRTGLALIGVLGAMSMAALLLVTLIIAAPNSMSSSNLVMFLNSVVVDFIAIPVGLVILQAMPHSAPAKTRLSVGRFFRLLVIGFFLLYTGAFLGNFLVYLLPWELMNPVDQMVTDTSIWVNILCFVVMAPIFEELLFRKFMLDRLLRYGERTAIIATALCFGLFHCNVYQFFYAFALGLVFGYVYCKTGKLWLCIVMHAIINFTGSIVAAWTSQNEVLLALYGYAVWALIITGLIFCIRDLRRKRFSVERCPLEKPNRYVYGNAAMIVFITYTLLSTLYSLLPDDFLQSLLAG